MSTLKVNTISEQSTGNGVAVDGVTLKDGALGTTASPVAIHSTSLNGGQFGGRRNLIINGAMQVAQRSTSASGITSSGFHALDRFANDITSAGTWTVSQDTDVPSGQGFAKSLKMDCTTANASLSAGSVLTVSHKFEGQDLQQLKKGTSDAEKVIVSFYVKSNKTGTYICELVDNDNTRQIAQAYTISSANTWEKKTITFDGDTSGTLDNDNAQSLRVTWWLVAGSNFTSGTLNTSWGATVNANRIVGQVNLADSTSNEWYITGVQLEVGEVATPFEHRSYGEELALCQRYYQKRTATNSRGSLLYGNGANTTTVISWADLPVQMRAVPTLTTSNLARDDSNGPVSVSSAAINTTYSSLVRPCVSCTTTSVTQYRPYTVGGNNNSSAYIDFDSEL